MCVRARGVCEARRSLMKSWAEMANLRSVKTSGCICAQAETRRGLWVCKGFSLASLIPRPSHPFRACLRSGFLALHANYPAPLADLICYVFLLPWLSLPQPSLSQSGTPAPCFKEPTKGTFQAGWCLWIRSMYGRGKVTMRRLWDSRYRTVILDMYIIHIQESQYAWGSRKQHTDTSVIHLTMLTHACMNMLIFTSSFFPPACLPFLSLCKQFFILIYPK